MIKSKLFIILSFLIFFSVNVYASSDVKLYKVDIDLTDHSALKRGARIFFEHCQGCHSLKYMRYSDLSDGINKLSGYIIKKDFVNDYFLHSTNVVASHAPILSSINKENGAKWFGKTPPDLSLIARYRGSDWLYTYMKSFYVDKARPWGVNNLLFPDVGMPHVLLKYQGVQILKEQMEHSNNPAKSLELSENGLLSKSRYDMLVKDLVTFLVYVSEPSKVDRMDLGYYVMGYFILLGICLFFLKQSYWEEIK
ncbi:MAG: cytochrome c1 [Candidatus Riesia sp.]|nr:cytochrome c1 [Candidatus Riesia sp.]